MNRYYKFGVGATVLVAASAIFQAPDPAEAARELAAIAHGDAD